MKNTYLNLIEQTFDFPQRGFGLQDDSLRYHGIDLVALLEEYGSPLRITYLPSIGKQINKAKELFRDAMAQYVYDGNYQYCYCTKSSHFSFVLEEVLQHDVHLEISSAFDIDIIKHLWQNGKIPKDKIIICNGFKPQGYLEKILELMHKGYNRVVPVLDNASEFDYLAQNFDGEKCELGIRAATEEEPKFQFYTSRLGMRRDQILSFYRDKIKDNPKFELKMLHFFMDAGIRDSIYFWNGFKRSIKLYTKLKSICPTLNSLNIGGGLPVQQSLGFNYDYSYMIGEMIRIIKEACDENNIPVPNIYTEFGTFTVGESGAVLFSVIGSKQQNDSELWYMINNSLMTTLPDTWGIDQRFLLLPLNKWNNEVTRVNIGGITCDNSDYYNSEAHISQLFLPKVRKDAKTPLYLGFFHTGAYQDNISGYGGLKHCLIPSPAHITIKEKDGELKYKLEYSSQKVEDMMNILGYYK